MDQFYEVTISNKKQVCHFDEIAYWEIKAFDDYSVLYCPILKHDRVVYGMMNEEGKAMYEKWLKYTKK